MTKSIISVMIHIKINDGIGVKQLILTREMAAGKCPFRAPTKNNRDEAKIAPFSDPNVEQATKSGIIQANQPSVLLANVTATASDDKIESGVRTAKYATLVIT